MPKFVDHEAKRREVVSLAAEMIARDGIDKVSLREIAEAADASTAIISHYFSAKTDLLLHTYQASLQESKARQGQVKAKDRDGLIALSAQILPLDEARKNIWRISIAFTAMALTDPAFGSEWEGNLHGARMRIEQILSAMAENGETRRDLDVETAARVVLSLIRNISTETMISSESWPPERQMAALESGVNMLLGYRATRHGSIDATAITPAAATRASPVKPLRPKRKKTARMTDS